MDRRVAIGATVMLMSVSAVMPSREVSAQSKSAAVQPTGERIAQGRELYLKHCASCHGNDLEGQPNWRNRRPNGRLPAPPHDATGHTWHHSDQVLFALTKKGPRALAGADYQTDMPGYEGILSDDAIWSVLVFIKSTWPAHIRARQARMTKQHQLAEERK